MPRYGQVISYPRHGIRMRGKITGDNVERKKRLVRIGTTQVGSTAVGRRSQTKQVPRLASLLVPMVPSKTVSQKGGQASMLDEKFTRTPQITSAVSGIHVVDCQAGGLSRVEPGTGCVRGLAKGSRLHIRSHSRLSHRWGNGETGKTSGCWDRTSVRDLRGEGFFALVQCG